MAMISRARGVLDTPHARGMTLYLLFENLIEQWKTMSFSLRNCASVMFWIL
jgi:hypothetical protein